MDWDLWAVERWRIATPWPECLAVLDLRFWSDPHPSNRRERPSCRVLAETWGWSRGRTQRLITDRERWADPIWSDVDVLRHPWDTRGTPVGQSDSDEPAQFAGNGTPVGHLWDTCGTPRSQDAPATPIVEPPYLIPITSKDPPPISPPTEPEPKPKPKPKRKPKATAPEDPRHRRASDIWAEVFKEQTGERYPWRFSGRPPTDRQRRELWVDQAVHVAREAWEARLEAAVRMYFAACAAGSAFPRNDPPTTRWFTDQLDVWLQRARPPRPAIQEPVERLDTPDAQYAAMVEAGMEEEDALYFTQERYPDWEGPIDS